MYPAGLLHEILRENKQTAPTELKGQFVCKSSVRNDLFGEMELLLYFIDKFSTLRYCIVVRNAVWHKLLITYIITVRRHLVKSKITSKFQITIPREIRDRLNLSVSDSIEWIIEKNRILVEPVNRPFLKYKGSIKIAAGNIKEDILKARKMWILKNK